MYVQFVWDSRLVELHEGCGSSNWSYLLAIPAILCSSVVSLGTLDITLMMSNILMVEWTESVYFQLHRKNKVTAIQTEEKKMSSLLGSA